MTLLQAALSYLNRGYSIIPVNPSLKEEFEKQPYIPWTEFQSRRPSEKEIRGWWTRWPKAMIGVVTGKISNLLSVDADTEQAIEKANELIPDSLEIPIVNTPRRGKHYHFSYHDGIRNSNDGLLHVRGEGGFIILPPSKREDGREYSWTNGIDLFNLPPPEPPGTLINYLKELALGGYKRGAQDGHARARMSTPEHEMFEYGRRDEDLFHTANCLVKGGMPQSEIEQVLERLIISWGEDSNLKWVRTKVESAMKRAERRERNFAEDVRKWVMSMDGHFSVTEYHAEARLSTREDKHAVTECLRRMVAEGIIEKYGEKRGVYRRVEKECNDIDFLRASNETIDLHWPFAIEQYFRTLPKNIVVVAGDPDAGKTAFLLNFTRRNMARHKIHYFSSEMGSNEFRERLSKFDLPLEKWSFDAKERSSNFADVIHPNEINIIDYLEITKDFYLVAGMIKEIFDKLKTGVAVIALQKNKGNDYGLGGMRGLEKARLYLTMEPGKAKIMKAKNWATSVNPNGMELSFKLVQGCSFVVEKDWSK
jgi:hypothetical protein